jgi:hypothetical protein
MPVFREMLIWALLRRRVSTATTSGLKEDQEAAGMWKYTRLTLAMATT